MAESVVLNSHSNNNKDNFIVNLHNKFDILHECKNQNCQVIINTNSHCTKCCLIYKEIEPQPNPRNLISDKKYCCDKKCFKRGNDEVDGIACRQCEAFCQCYCKCITHMEYIYGNHLITLCRRIDIIGPHNCKENGLLFKYK